MDGDFEYHITSPVSAEPVVSKEPIIILFGWAGCVDRYLAKYSEIYEKKGFTTIRYTTCLKVISPTVIDVKKIHNLAGNVLNVLIDKKFDNHPIFFHVFSNTGATVYRFVSDLIREKHPDEFKVRGCIFDSCPAKLRNSGLFLGALALTKGNLLIRYMIAFVVLLRALTLCYYNAMLSYLTGKTNYYRLWDALKEEPNMCPQLFLFSKADKVCCWDIIQELANYRQKKGVDVKTVLFKESGHVQHMIKYREEYQQHVFNFIDEKTEVEKMHSPIPANF